MILHLEGNNNNNNSNSDNILTMLSSAHRSFRLLASVLPHKKQTTIIIP